MPFRFFLLSFLLYSFSCFAQTGNETYAEKLGFAKGSKVVILHVDDAGMSYESNEGTIRAMTEGVANSCSVMMPCSWVPGMVRFIKSNPGIDAGLHLTLTSEWADYRWVPLAGKQAVPGLVDSTGSLWRSVADVVAHATPDEVEKEIRAQVDRAERMGFIPTHYDSHMGTLFASPAFLERYVKIGIEKKTPVMFPAGHNTLIQKQSKLPGEQMKALQQTGQLLWRAGLPVLDDLHNFSYEWKIPANIKSDKQLQAFKTTKYIQALQELQPGVTMMIMHCTASSPIFKYISDSGPLRQADMLSMLDPAFKAALKKEGIILTTWRALKQKRDAVQ